MKQLFDSDSQEREQEHYDFNGEGDRGTLQLKKSFKGDSRFKLTSAFHQESTDVNQLSSKTKDALSEKEIKRLQRQKQDDDLAEDQFQEEKNRLLNVLATVVPHAEVFGGSLVTKKTEVNESNNEKPTRKFEGLIQERFDPTKVVMPKKNKQKKQERKANQKMKELKTKKVPIFEKYVKVLEDWNFKQENKNDQNSELAGLFSNTQSLLSQPLKREELKKEKQAKEIKEIKEEKNEDQKRKKNLKREDKKKRKQKEKNEQTDGANDFEKRMLKLIAKFKSKNK